MDLIFLKPYFQEKIWGGNKLNKIYNRPELSEKTGEAWVASAHPNGLSIISSPKEFEGITLKSLYESHSEYFGPHPTQPFPLLVKIIDAKENLSVQVHPNDEYSKQHEGLNEYGKNECWYILSAENGAKIVYGHKAGNREEFKKYVKNGDFKKLLREVPVQEGDFFDVPAGTIHSIGHGVTVLETQQSSDITYRVFDYDRKDNNGISRTLHLEQSADVTLYPHKDSKYTKRNTTYIADTFIELVANNYFKVQKATVAEALFIETDKNYHLVTVIEGSGSIHIFDQNYKIKKGD